MNEYVNYFYFVLTIAPIIPRCVGLPSKYQKEVSSPLTQNKRLCNSVIQNYLDSKREKVFKIFPTDKVQRIEDTTTRITYWAPLGKESSVAE